MTRDEAMMELIERVAQADRNAAADILDEISSLTQDDGIGQVADLIRDGEYDEHDTVQRTARHRQAGVQQGLDMAKAALEADAKLCDCFAHSEGECACGAWCEWKSITSARAVEIVSKLGGDDA